MAAKFPQLYPMPSSTATTLTPLTAAVQLAQTGAVGGVAAALSQMLHHPIYQLKNQMQNPGFSMRGFLHQSLSNPSKTLYGGITQRIFAVMPEKALKMQAWEISILMLTYARNSETKRVSSWLIAGSVAGMATSLVICPSELVMVQATMQKINMRQFVKKFGILKLYSGMSASLCRDVTFNSLFFTIRHWLIARWEARQQHPATKFQAYLAGIYGGISGAIIACPFDVAKTRLQTNVGGANRGNVASILRETVQREGMLSLWRGVVPRTMVVSSTLSFFYLLFDVIKRNTAFM